jgi:hypothetical protein
VQSEPAPATAEPPVPEPEPAPEPEPEPEPEPGPETEPAATAAPEPEPEEPDIPEDAEPEAGEFNLEKAWAAVLARVKKKNMPYYFFIVEGTPELTDNILTILFQPGHQFKKEQAQDSRNIPILQETVNKIFGRELRIRMNIDRGSGGEAPAAEDAGPRPEPQPEPEPEPQSAAAPQELDLFATVQEGFPKSVEVEG